MRITDLLKPQSIDLNAVVADKPAAVERLVDLMEAGGNLADKALYKARVLAREAEGSTGIGEGIAIPHAKTEAVKTPGLASMIVRAGVDYESLDEEPAFLFFLIAAPAGGENVHLEVLSRLSRMLMDDEFHEALMNAKTPEEYLHIIDEAEKIQIEQEEAEAEEERKQAEAEQAATTAKKATGAGEGAGTAGAGAASVAAAAAGAAADSGKPFVAAVTACPTGIAHTYMAAEALERKAAAMGIDIKVETNGSGGVKNTLTAADIERAAGIIVACDKNVPVQRFAGKKVLFVKVSAGIKEPENLINTILKGEAPVFSGEGAPSDEPAAADWRRHPHCPGVPV